MTPIFSSNGVSGKPGAVQYDHSERLGDAFEYLLSVLGSQGDAGQFRTPRHIIDFIVKVVDPKKHETVLDPACGTAGFLISSYKHILRANTDADGNSALSPDERGLLAENFRGYDISPDMVRLSLVNLYLHGFNDPHIFEYDTLTSQDHWNEYADVILANPPFMSPKGGIKPHKRFSVQSKRSEVLFVDYMAEHLAPGGRAGIIVPEGIIFQSQTAYKQLRKMLVEESLVAIVSLPAGVFNPYSGVKTSILILDKSLARQSDTIAFFKIENDGFGLGAQRREIAKNDLPQAEADIGEYLSRLRAREALDDFQPTLGLVVQKEKIAADGGYNLGGERYREGSVRASKYPTVPIGDTCELINGRAFKPEDWERANTGGLPIVRIQNLNTPGSAFNYYTGEVRDRHVIDEGELLFSWSGSRGTSFGAHVWKGKKAVLNQHIFKVGFDGSQATKMYLLHALNKAVTEVEENLHGGVGLVHITKGNLEKIEIPLPPLEIQKEIVAEIEGYQKVIDGARAVLDNYRPHIPIHADWPIIQLGEICSFKNGLNFSKASSGHSLKIVGVGNFQSNLYAPLADLDEVEVDAPPADEYLVKGGDILFVRSNGNPDLVGRSLIVPPPREPTTFSGFTIRCRIEDVRALPLFYAHFFKSRDFAEMIKTVGRGANIRNLSQGILRELKVPLPPLATQQAIVGEIEAEQALVAPNRELIARMEKKIQATLARIWGEPEETAEPVISQ